MSQHGASKPKVALIGAGLTGLLAAHGLIKVDGSLDSWKAQLLTGGRQNGFDVAVFEREASLEARRRDWSILVHWAMPILAKLLPEAVLADLPKAVCNPHLNFDAEVESLPVVNGVTGAPLFKSPTPGARRVTRQKLRRLLAETLSVEINWGKALDGLTVTRDSVELRFQDGETFVADYVLGTDGASSKVRELLIGTEASALALSDVMFATGIVQYGDAEQVRTVVEQHPVALIYMGTSSTGAVGGTSALPPPSAGIPLPLPRTKLTVFSIVMDVGD